MKCIRLPHFAKIRKANSFYFIFLKDEKIILFSPASASFDDFKNFEDRGKYFNYQLRKIGINGKK